MPSSDSKPYSVELESLRGIAAIAVVLAHASAILSVDGISAYWGVPLSGQSPATLVLSLIGAFFNPGTAVVLFFVLSGYVLTRSLEGDLGLYSLGKYSVRRAFRLLPPMWISIILMWLMLSVVRSTVDAAVFSDWFKAVFLGKLSAQDVANNFFLIDFKANPVTWTMYVEVIGSAFVPLSLLSSKAFGEKWKYALLALLLVLSVATFPSLSFAYIVCFQVGIVLAQNRFLKITKYSGAIVVAAVAAIVCERLLFPSQRWGLIVNIAASAAVMMVVTSRAETIFLKHKITRFIGVSSYSLYLFHLPVIYIAGTAAAKLGIRGNGVWPSLTLLAVVIVVSVGLAYICYSLIEKPAKLAGRKLTERRQLFNVAPQPSAQPPN